MKTVIGVLAMALTIAGLAGACLRGPAGVETNPAALARQAPHRAFEAEIENYSRDLFKEGKRIFRYDTFGSEDFWGGTPRRRSASTISTRAARPTRSSTGRRRSRDSSSGPRAASTTTGGSRI